MAVLAEICQKTGSLLVLDEAYLNFVDGQWDSLSLLEGAAAESVILLRSMTKDYALTGLRLGYSLASPNVTASLARLQPDWSVNSLAQAAGLVALADADYLPAARQAVNAAKTYLNRGTERPRFSSPTIGGQLFAGGGWQRSPMARPADAPGNLRPRLRLLRPARLRPHRYPRPARLPAPGPDHHRANPR